MSLHDQDKALARLPAMGVKPPFREPLVMKATGTYGDSSIYGTQVGQTQGNLSQLRMTQDHQTGTEGGNPESPKFIGKSLEIPVKIGQNTGPARVAELADAQDLKSCDRKVVRVRFPPRAFPINTTI